MLIIAENNTDQNGDGILDFPDDDADGGKITFDTPTFSGETYSAQWIEDRIGTMAMNLATEGQPKVIWGRTVSKDSVGEWNKLKDLSVKEGIIHLTASITSGGVYIPANLSDRFEFRIYKGALWERHQSESLNGASIYWEARVIPRAVIAAGQN